MRPVLVLALLLGVCACEAQKAQSAPQSPGGSPPRTMDWATVLRRNMLAAGSTFDGALVTGLRQTGACTGVITTAQGSTAVRWRDLGNLAPTTERGRINFDIPADGRTHVLSAQDGAVGTRINMGLGLLDEQCSGA